MVDETRQILATNLQRFSNILSPEEIEQILAIQDQPLPTGIRINRLKADPLSAIQALSQRYGWEVSPIPFCDHAWMIEHADTSPGNTIEHRQGQYYLQDAASMAPVVLFDLTEPQPLILDLAASPGGKTTHLIDRTHDRGFILANDASQSRIAALRSVLTDWGGIQLAITQYPGESFGNWYPETFDIVLLDAPCSMENYRPTPNRPWRNTTTDERIRLQARQVQLLISGLKTLKVGGQLVYATCSLAPEEDEAVVDAVLSAYPAAVVVDDVRDKIPFGSPGLTHFAGQSFHPDLRHALRLWPHKTGMSGFFCVRLTKTAPLPTIAETPPQRDFSRTGLVALKKTEAGPVLSKISEAFGWDFAQFSKENDLALYQRHGQVFLIPGAYLRHFRTLPYETIGMPLGKQIGDQIEPSAEFISRFGHLFTRGVIEIEDQFVAQWVAGRDLRHPTTPRQPTGQYLLVTDSAGRNLGLGKLLPKRLRNMLPRQSI